MQGKRTGLVTSTFVVHATPASFAAHESFRYDYTEIFKDYMVSKPDLIFGGGHPAVDIPLALTTGYKVVTNKTQLDAVTDLTNPGKLAFSFHSSLSF